MSKVRIYKSGEEWFQEDGQLVFLNGSNDKWHNKIIEKLNVAEIDVSIACPMYNISNDIEAYAMTVNWDLFHTRLASFNGAVVFWCDNNGDPSTLLFNLAEWIQNLKYRKIYQPDRLFKLIIGIDDDFILKKYIMFRLFDELPDQKIYLNVEDMGNAIIESLAI